MKTVQHIAATIATVAVLSVGGSARAAIVVYSGSDPGVVAVGPGSAAAAASFDAAAGPTTLIDFEGFDLGARTSGLLISPGVTLSGPSSPQDAITDTPHCAASLCGFNTTAGGSKFASLLGDPLTFTFANPISSFGAYFSGVQAVFNRIEFSDGSFQNIAIPNPGSGLAFLGFTDFGRSISSITIGVTGPRPGGGTDGDIIGIDDVRFGFASVPEPATWTTMILGFAGVGAALRRRRDALAS